MCRGSLSGVLRSTAGKSKDVADAVTGYCQRHHNSVRAVSSFKPVTTSDSSIRNCWYAGAENFDEQLYPQIVSQIN